MQVLSDLHSTILNLDPDPATQMNHGSAAAIFLEISLRHFLYCFRSADEQGQGDLGAEVQYCRTACRHAGHGLTEPCMI